MISILSDKIGLYLVSKTVDHKGIEADIYSYGIELILSTIINVSFILLVSSIFGCLIESILFMIVFGMLRTTAGGIHAKTHITCLMAYSTVSFILIFICQFIANYNNFMVGIVVISVIFISVVLVFRYAPVGSENKPLSEQEILEYRKKSRTIVVILASLIMISLLITPQNMYYVSVCSGAMLFEGLTLIPKKNSSVK